MGSRAVSVAGTGGTAARAITQIGADIILPSGGPWKIFKVWGMAARKTAIPDQGSGGELIVVAASGDIEPNPAPGKFPLIGTPCSSSVNSTISASPLNLFDVDWDAAGRATIQLFYRNQLAMTTGDNVRAGLIFGTERPEIKPIKFCDSVQASFASAAEQTVGSITLAEKATRITGVMGVLTKGDAITIAEPIIGAFRLASSDMLMPPSIYPFNQCFDSADGTLLGSVSIPQAQFIPVDIEINGGAIIDVYAITDVSVTGNADVSIYLAYE